MREDDYTAFNRAALLVRLATYIYVSQDRAPGAVLHAWKDRVMDHPIETKVQSHA